MTKWKVLDATIAWICQCVREDKGGIALAKLDASVYNMTMRHGDTWAHSLANIVEWEEEICLSTSEEKQAMAWERLALILHRAAQKRLSSLA